MGKLKSAIFGEIDFKDENIIRMEEGILGFAGSKQFILIPHEKIEAFFWLHSLDEADLCFLTTSPRLFFPEYKPEINRADNESLGLEDPDQGELLVLITVPENIEEMTANLAGPILINHQAVTAKQIVVKNDEYGTKHKLLAEMPEKAAVS